MTPTKTAVAIVFSCFLVAAADAQDVTLAAAKNRGAVKLSKEDLERLLPRAAVRGESERSNRTWMHETDGTISGTATMKAGAGRGIVKGSGTWRVTADGKYCVDIAWTRSNEKWCRTLYRLGNDLIAFKGDGDDAPVERKLVLD